MLNLTFTLTAPGKHTISYAGWLLGTLTEGVFSVLGCQYPVTYETFEEAERSVSWNLSGSGGTWEGDQYDWIEIVNLESWTNPFEP